MKIYSSKSSWLYIAFTIVFLFFLYPLRAQDNTTTSTDSILGRINRQISIFPQEKIHIHTDKSFYISGEKVWLRAYLMNAYTNYQDTSSLYVYGELINPLDSIVSRIKIINRDGAYAGYMPLNEELPAGTYTLRFYTQYMQNLGEDYFFYKNINIGTPTSIKFRAEVESVLYDKNKVNLSIIFKDIKTGKKVSPKNIFIADNKSLFSKRSNPQFKKSKINEKQSVGYRIDTSKGPKKQIYIEYEIDGSLCSEFIPIPLASDDFHVDFFPEGGRILPIGDNFIAFKAISSNGFSTDITGIVYNEDGDTITSFNSTHKGMGQFLLAGDLNKKYYAKCTNSQGITKQFELPITDNNGYNLTVRQIKEHIHLSIFTLDDIPKGLKLLMHNGGNIINIIDWKTDNTSISIAKNHLPIGVIQCMLLDNNGFPLSERLFFNFDSSALPIIQQNNNKKKYERRDLVVSEFEINNNTREPLNGSFSIAVTDNKDIKVDSTQNILTTLLLTSELKGHIEDPSYYFKGDRYSNYALDLLMLTQGWRRYNMSHVIQGQFQYPKFDLEFLHTITGHVKGGLFLNKKSKGTPVFLFNLKTRQSEMTTTNEEGYFRFESILPDSLKLMVVASSPKGKTRYDLTIDDEIFPKLNINLVQAKKIENSFFNDYIKKADIKYTLENGMRVIHLKDVEVTAKRKEEVKSRSVYSSPFNTKIDLESTFYKNSRLTEVLEKQVNTQIISKPDGTIKVFFRSNRYASINEEGPSAAIMVDDFENDFILEIDPFVSEFESMEIIKNPAPILGFKGSGGAVILTTKRGIENFNSPPPSNIAAINPLGFQSYAEFYSPKYETIEEKLNERPDLRSTIYWNPNVKVVNGKAKVGFYTADETSTYSVFIDGISDNGEPLHIINKIGE